MYLKEQQQRQREILYLLAHSPAGRNSQGWRMLKPGAKKVYPDLLCA